MGILHGVIQETCGYQAGGVSHVYHQQRAYLVGNLAHAGIVPLTAVGGTSTDNQFGLVLQGQLLHFVVVHAASFLVQVVTHWVVEYARGVDRGAM